MLCALGLPAAAQDLFIEQGPVNWGLTGITLNNFYSFTVHNGALFAGGRTVIGSAKPTARLLRSTDGVEWSEVSGIPFNENDSELRRIYSASDGYLYIVTDSGRDPPRLYRQRRRISGWQLVQVFQPEDNYGRSFAEFGGCLYLGMVMTR